MSTIKSIAINDCSDHAIFMATFAKIVYKWAFNSPSQNWWQRDCSVSVLGDYHMSHFLASVDWAQFLGQMDTVLDNLSNQCV